MVQISANKKRTLSVQINPPGAKIDGVLEWSVLPPGGVTLFPTTDGLSCEIAWSAPLASQTVTVKGDADLGSGTKEISDSVAIETLAAEATGLTIGVGPEEDI